MPSFDPTPEMMAQLLPLAAAWAEEQEAHILARGAALPAVSLRDAAEIGVRHPERVRVRAVPGIPMPEQPLLRSVCEATGFLGPLTAGLSLRYGIFVHASAAGDRSLVAHELVHTAQYERLGGIAPFLRQYLQECFTIGYPDAPLEQEAIAVSARVLQGA